MEIEKLNKEDFMATVRGVPTARFTYIGLVTFNKAAVKHLDLYDKTKNSYAIINICRDKDSRCDFGVFKDTEGWQLRKAWGGTAIFNNVGLARHVIDATWERGIRAVGTVKPTSIIFRIAKLPLDDDKNKDVFALLRKKG